MAPRRRRSDAEIKCENFSEAIDKILAIQGLEPAERELLQRARADVERAGDVQYDLLQKVMFVHRDKSFLPEALAACSRFVAAKFAKGHVFGASDEAEDEGEEEDLGESEGEDDDDDDGEGASRAKRARVEPTLFAGAGRSLGELQPTSTHAAALFSTVAPLALVVDQSRDTTCVKVCLPDGSKSELVLNLDHTVAALRAHVATLLADGARTFQLQRVYPRATLALDCDAMTIFDAKLQKESVIVLAPPAR